MLTQARPRSIDVGIRVGPFLAQSTGAATARPSAVTRRMPGGATLGDALLSLTAQYPRLADYVRLESGCVTTQYLCVALNGEAVGLPADLGRELRDGDRLILLVALAGD